MIGGTNDLLPRLGRWQLTQPPAPVSCRDASWKAVLLGVVGLAGAPIGVVGDCAGDQALPLG